MKKIGLARGLLLPAQQEALGSFFTRLGYQLEHLDELEKDRLVKLSGIIITTAVPEEKLNSADKTQTVNAYFQVVVQQAYEADPHLPIILVSSGKNDPQLIKVFLAPRIREVEVLALDDCRGDEQELGRPATVLMVSINCLESTAAYLDKVKPAVLNHLREVTASNGA